MGTNKVSIFIVSLCLLGTRSFGEKFPHPSKTARQSCTEDEDLATSLIDAGLSKKPSMAAGLLRAGFHDCITATTSNSGSGCNGSLRLNEELKYKGNVRLEKTIKFLKPIQGKSCMSWADLLQLGVERAMVKSGGPAVSLGRGRTDVSSADDDDLPSEKSSYSVLLKYFKKRGFNSREMIVGQVGGHSLGKFRGKRFSASPNKFDNLYAINLLDILNGGDGLTGHNELASDLKKIAKNQGASNKLSSVTPLCRHREVYFACYWEYGRYKILWNSKTPAKRGLSRERK